MAAKGVKTVKIPDDIEYRFWGNFFGIIIASFGLLGGVMMSNRSPEYWFDDIVPIFFLSFLIFRLFRTFIATMNIEQAETLQPSVKEQPERVYSETGAPVIAKIGNKAFTAEEVMDQVAKRIESNKEAAGKKNKMVNNSGN